MYNDGRQVYKLTEIEQEAERCMNECNQLGVLAHREMADFLPPPIFDIDFQIVRRKDIDEQGNYNDQSLVPFWSLSSGERQIAYIISNFVYHVVNINSVHYNDIDVVAKLPLLKYKYINVIFDEIELYFHPDLQRRFLFLIAEALKSLHIEHIEGINILLVTHSPFVLNDLPKSNVLALSNKNENVVGETFCANIQEMLGQKQLYFYDAAAPIVEKDSIDMNIAFYGDRYSVEKGKDEEYDEWLERIKKQEASYINLPMNKEEYERFYNELINAEVVVLHDFEKREIFEGCMPIEIMAKRGEDTLRFGPLKPVGFDDPRTGKRPYAVVQLRQDNKEGNLYNIVGFQTNLKYGEQKRVFSLIPGLENASFVKYGVMHRNTYIQSPNLLNNIYQLKKNKKIFFAGQITGVEGYVESISSGFLAGINIVNEILEKEPFVMPKETVIGALADYISTPNDKFQPMNANFGILPQLSEKIKDKKERYKKLSDKSLKYIEKLKL